MTVHKAKGLGFPVVIVLLYGESSRGFEHTLVRQGGEVSLVRLTRSVADRDPTLRALYEEEAAKEKVNRLNGLYVALTRAKRELYVIGVKRERDTFPFDLLPADGFQASAEKGVPVFETAPPESGPPLSHETRPVPAPFASGRLGRLERRRGERVHRMLELVEYIGADTRETLRAAAARTAREAREDPAGLADAAEALARVLRGTELGRLFTPAPGRLVLREQEFCDEAGRLFRMDRVVVDGDRVTVVDFKTGTEETGRYEEDVRAYARILRQVYPGRTVEALLAFVDAGSVRRVV
jgi:ATP-dependent helicase/nuclease subunit A